MSTLPHHSNTSLFDMVTPCITTQIYAEPDGIQTAHTTVKNKLPQSEKEIYIYTLHRQHITFTHMPSYACYLVIEQHCKMPKTYGKMTQCVDRSIPLQ